MFDLKERPSMKQMEGRFLFWAACVGVNRTRAFGFVRYGTASILTKKR